MNAEQIHNILLTQHYPGVKTPARLVETHISWVILTPEFAFKIKKPVHFDFLDFSTLEQRQFYCAEEVRLNRRLSKDMYLGVLPIGSPDNWPAIGNETAPIIDYAIWMRRMDEQRQMDMLLAENKVQASHLEALADKLVAFHQNAILGQENVYAQGDYLKDFEDLYHEEQDAVLWLGEDVAEQFKHWRQEIPAFIQRHSIRMRARFETGFWVEGHGDLHTRNIFLLEEPVVFDCIEFNAHFRQLDVLNELAALNVDAIWLMGVWYRSPATRVAMVPIR